MEWSGVKWSGVEWSGVEWSGVEWSGVGWSGVEWGENHLSACDLLNHCWTQGVALNFDSGGVPVNNNVDLCSMAPFFGGAYRLFCR